MIIVTLIYASTERANGVSLWDDLYDISSNMDYPWIVGGNQNVIWDEAERFGGLLVHYDEVEDLGHCLNICQLKDLVYSESIYTQWNGISDKACIFKRLDICLENQAFQSTSPDFEVENAIKQGLFVQFVNKPVLQ